MPPLTPYFNRRLTALETTLIIGFVAILGGLGYLGYQFTTAELLAARVHAALPRVCDAIRDEREQLVSAIEAYKAHFGAYPPDHVISRQPLIVDPITNTLFYELVGVIYNPTNRMYQVGGQEPAEAKYVKDFFQVEGFKNCAETPGDITRFLKIQPLPARQLHDDPDVFAVGFQVPYEGLSPEVVWQFNVTPWRYVSTNPTNNPSKFDLWIGVNAGDRTLVIGNWEAVH